MNHQTAQKAVSDMLPAFDRAERQIQREIEIWYQRFADNNGISLTEAKKMLSARDLEELKWDIDEYIKYGKKNAIDGKWMKELENASARYHMLGGCGLKKQKISIVICDDVDCSDYDLTKASGFEVSAEVLRTDGIYEKIFFSYLAPIELVEHGTWKFELPSARDVLRCAQSEVRLRRVKFCAARRVIKEGNGNRRNVGTC